MERKLNICAAIEKLEKEQSYLTENEKEFQFICMPQRPDTIPFMLFNGNGCSFTAYCLSEDDCFRTPFFRLEKFDNQKCCAVLSLLKAIDMDGCPVESCDEIYSLSKTECCVNVDISCFCMISPLSIELVNRPLPIIEPKC